MKFTSFNKFINIYYEYLSDNENKIANIMHNGSRVMIMYESDIMIFN